MTTTQDRRDFLLLEEVASGAHYVTGDPGPMTMVGGTEWGVDSPWVGLVDLSSLEAVEAQALAAWFERIGKNLCTRGLYLVRPWIEKSSRAMEFLPIISSVAITKFESSESDRRSLLRQDRIGTAPSPQKRWKPALILVLVPCDLDAGNTQRRGERTLRLLPTLYSGLASGTKSEHWLRTFDPAVGLLLARLHSQKERSRLADSLEEADGERVEILWQRAFGFFIADLTGQRLFHRADEDVEIRPGRVLDFLGLQANDPGIRGDTPREVRLSRMFALACARLPDIGAAQRSVPQPQHGEPGRSFELDPPEDFMEVAIEAGLSDAEIECAWEGLRPRWSHRSGGG